MPKIKLNLQSLNIPEKINRSQQIVSALTDNPDFTSPQPTLAQVKAAAKQLEDAYAATQAARQDARLKTNQQNEKEDELDRVLTQVAGYVESIAGDDEAKIMSAGMSVRAPHTPAGDLPAPQALSATAGDDEGEIDLAWDKVNKAKSYVIERGLDPQNATAWSHAGVSTRSQATVEGLTSGTKYWFRVAAVGPNGQSPWSDPATRIAP